jgi:hypothetical protein
VRHCFIRQRQSALSVVVNAAFVAAVTFATVPTVMAATPKATAATQPTSTMVATRRITESQYRHSIADLFGGDIQINGRFEPDNREHLLLAIGSSMLSISAAGFEQYFSMGRSISDQVLNDKRRAKFATCAPADAKVADDKCTAEFVRTYGRFLFRRPLTAEETQMRVALAASGANQAHDYHAGLKLALTSLLSAPQFLFRIESAEADKKSGQLRLDGYTKAARLSYLLWDTAPDEELLTAAANGDLHTDAGLEKQLNRLLASPRMEAGARAFFADMLQLDKYESTTKDAAIYPKYSQAVADSGKEQTLKTLVDQLITKNGDYRDIFTSRDTFIDRSLAAIYQVPFVANEGWKPYTFPAESDHSGVLTQLTFLAVFSHPGRSSPTKRGVAINEIFQCIPTPTPPANVDFSIVNDTANPNFKTVRSRLLAHAEDEACSGCHIKSDALGLSLERFDSLAQRRLLENGEPIDVSSELDGKKFQGAQGLGVALRDNKKIPSCLVRNVYAYGIGQEPTQADAPFLEKQTQSFAQDGFRFTTLLRRIAGSSDFFKVTTLPAAETAAHKLATNR